MNGWLENKRVAVTGGGSGIGEASARLAASRGATVAVLDINGEAAESVARAIVEDGGRAKAWTLDVRDASAVDEVTGAVEEDLGPLDGLVASAGILQRPQSPEEFDIATFDQVVAVNQRGVYLSCVAAGRRMAKRGSGSIVTISSISALRSMPLHSYAPAKAAVISISEGLATEWGRSGVRVNAVAPGYTLTPALKNAIDAGQRNPDDLTETSALGRLIEPVEIAEGVVFLLSDHARAITGITLPIDAGWLAAPSWQTYGGVPAARSR